MGTSYAVLDETRARIAESRATRYPDDEAAQGEVRWAYDIPQDQDAAAVWFRRAADQGHADAAYRLGDMYDKGQGVPQDHTEAAKLLRYAADHGHWSAQRDFAVLCFYGRGVPRDHDAVARWLRRAAEAGRVRYGTDETSTGQRQFRFSAG